ncbi:hypothetical protein SKTS_21560 [Sulfurimicrobium lacus]|uniref:Cyclic di-GMP receptor atypical PilZ domain-containing protein n=1 Tax=Sulfurimicrobium lacus TaxID=2715678 RepID=A0A6F8VD56_9PROT|nr:PilZ domain-containing protein [Sulfurimicrobium lacus]BCB27270.1 hypothetical protein SKTS_21560 [Sulfurimicrobium lacus]
MPNKFESNGIFYAAELPLSWTPLGRLQPLQNEQWQHAGAALLRALAVLETPVAEVERDTASASGKAMERLEAKLDLALSLMTQLARQQAELPPLHHVFLRAKSLEWFAESVPAVQQMVLVSLHISPKLPQALMLPATVTGVELEANGISRVKANFADLSEDMEEWLERTLFRFHRRSIQQSHSRQHDS